jgi:hypothetical protein
MKSPVVRRSIVVVAGHKTSVSLEEAFWNPQCRLGGCRQADERSVQLSRRHWDTQRGAGSQDLSRRSLSSDDGEHATIAQLRQWGIIGITDHDRGPRANSQSITPGPAIAMAAVRPRLSRCGLLRNQARYPGKRLPHSRRARIREPEAFSALRCRTT